MTLYVGQVFIHMPKSLTLLKAKWLKIVSLKPIVEFGRSLFQVELETETGYKLTCDSDWVQRQIDVGNFK